MTLPQTQSPNHLSEEEALMYDWRIYSIRKALEQRGKATGVLHIQDLLDLGHLEQYHYFGSKACDRAIETLQLNPTSQVLDIGSGVGGPARYISHKTGCQIQGVELREDFNNIARELTERVGLHQKIQYLTGSILSPQVINALEINSFDSVVSFLCFLHIKERQALLDICFRSLKEGGQIYIEDYVANAPLTPDIQAKLRDEVQAPYVPTHDVYRHHFEQAGFTDICFVDLTTGWRSWVEERYQNFIKSKEESVRIFGEDAYNHRSQFYQTIHNLFESLNIGGCLITASKPCQLKTSQLPDAYFSVRTSVYSEQYHFFLEDGSLIALRYFRTGTLEHYSAWWCDTQGHSRELLNTSESQCSQPHIQIIKDDCSGKIRLVETDLEIDFQVATQLSWGVPAEKESHPVIHQPQLLGTVRMGDQTQTAVGYCKIFEGSYPKFWGYHFVHAFFPNYGIIWSADATFGQEKYNYFKLLNLPQEEEKTILHGDASYHRQASAYTQINAQSYHLKFEQKTFGSWSSVLRNNSSTMESDLHLDYKHALLEIDGQKITEGVCLKESCFGTLA